MGISKRNCLKFPKGLPHYIFEAFENKKDGPKPVFFIIKYIAYYPATVGSTISHLRLISAMTSNSA